MTDVLVNLTVVIISQYVHIPNHHIVHFKLIQFCELYLKAERGKKKNDCLKNPSLKKDTGHTLNVAT